VIKQFNTAGSKLRGPGKTWAAVLLTSALKIKSFDKEWVEGAEE
jgi:hypothetical protein